MDHLRLHNQKPSRLAGPSLGQYCRAFEWVGVHTASGHAIAFSPDGKRMLTGASDGVVALYDLQGGSILHLVQFPTHVQIICLHWAPSGEIFIGTTGHQLTYLIWLEEEGRFELDFIPFEFTDAISSLAFDVEGEKLAVAFGSCVEVWQRVQGEWEHRWGTEVKGFGYIYDIFFTGANHLVIGLENGIVLWRPERASTYPLSGLYMQHIDRISFMRDNHFLAVCHQDQVQLYQMAGEYPHHLSHIMEWSDTAEHPFLSDHRIRSCLSMEGTGGTVAVVWCDTEGMITVANVPSVGRLAAQTPAQVLRHGNQKRVIDALKTFRFGDTCYVAAVYTVKDEVLPCGGITSVELWTYGYSNLPFSSLHCDGSRRSDFNQLLMTAIKRNQKKRVLSTSHRNFFGRKEKHPNSWVKGVEGTLNQLGKNSLQSFILMRLLQLLTVVFGVFCLVIISYTLGWLAPNSWELDSGKPVTRVPGPIIIIFALVRRFWGYFAHGVDRRLTHAQETYEVVLQDSCATVPEYCT